jgi:hypothetical protein
VTISFTHPLTGRRLRSDWMAVERERGISVSSAVMSFEHEGLAFNLLRHAGPPGFHPIGIQQGHLPHPDRGPPTLPSPARGGGSGRGPLHAAQRRQRGIEEQTRKLFEVCRLRGLPIITFVNKLDREGRDPFDLLDKIEQSLALDVTRLPGRSAWGATFSAPTICSPMRFCCPSAASTTGSPNRSAAAASTTRNCRGYCRKKRSPNCARRSRWRRGYAPVHLSDFARACHFIRELRALLPGRYQPPAARVTEGQLILVNQLRVFIRVSFFSAKVSYSRLRSNNSFSSRNFTSFIFCELKLAFNCRRFSITISPRANWIASIKMTSGCCSLRRDKTSPSNSPSPTKITPTHLLIVRPPRLAPSPLLWRLSSRSDARSHSPPKKLPTNLSAIPGSYQLRISPLHTRHLLNVAWLPGCKFVSGSKYTLSQFRNFAPNILPIPPIFAATFSNMLPSIFQ